MRWRSTSGTRRRVATNHDHRLDTSTDVTGHPALKTRDAYQIGNNAPKAWPTMSADTPAGAAALPPDAPLSIAYLTYRGKPHVGGQGVYTRHLTKALVDLGHSVEVFGGQPYPVLDERVELHQAAEPRPVQRPLPRPLPGVLGAQDPGRLRSRRPVTHAARSPSRSRSAARARRELKPRAGEFDLVHDNQCLGYGDPRASRS